MRWASAIWLIANLPPVGAWAYDPLNGDYGKDDPLDVRVMTYNHGGNFISNPGADAEFSRILSAVDPDVVCFQEFPQTVSQTAVAGRLNAILPTPGGWHIHFGLLGGIRTVIASRFPLTMTAVDTIPASSTRGVTIALVDLPDDDYGVDLYLMGVHLKCCGNPGGSEDESRQRSADAMAHWLGDARGMARPAGDHVVLPANTPILALGDFNLVGGPLPENTLLTGNIQDEATFGPDVTGDWDDTHITDLRPTDPFTGNDFTWQGNSNFPPGRLDRIFYTDSAVVVAASFILNSNTMSPAARAATGLQPGDTLPQNSSDHLPVVVDLQLAACPDADDDGACDADDGCPADANKTAPGRCGCGAPETPADGDMTLDGVINGMDVSAFAEAVVTNDTGTDALCHGDFDEDGFVTEADAPAFVLSLLSAS